MDIPGPEGAAEAMPIVSADSLETQAPQPVTAPGQKLEDHLFCGGLGIEEAAEAGDGNRPQLEEHSKLEKTWSPAEDEASRKPLPGIGE